MNLFRCNDSLNSFGYPIFKIISCILIIIIGLLVSIYRDRIFHINTTMFRTIVSLFSCCVIITSVLCIYISCAEMILISEKRHKEELLINARVVSGRAYLIDDIVSLVHENYSIEILIATDKSRNNIIEVGSRSDLKPGTSIFFNKTYYIEDNEYKDELDFKKALLPYMMEDRTLIVLTIDGITQSANK